MTSHTLEPVRQFCRAMGDLYATVLGSAPPQDGRHDYWQRQATQHLEWMMSYRNEVWAAIHGLDLEEPYRICLRVVAGQACLRFGNTECPGCTDQAYLENVSLYSRSGRTCVLVAEPSEYHDGLARVAEMDAADFGLDFFHAVSGRPILPQVAVRATPETNAGAANVRDTIAIQLAENEDPLPSIYAASFVFVNPDRMT